MLEEGCCLTGSQIITTKDKLPYFVNNQLHLQNLPLRPALCCHFTCKCDAHNWSNFHNSRSSWLWQFSCDWRPGSHCLPATKYSLGPVGSLVLIKTTGLGSTGAGVASPSPSAAGCPYSRLPHPSPTPHTIRTCRVLALGHPWSWSWQPQSLQLIRRHLTVVNSLHMSISVGIWAGSKIFFSFASLKSQPDTVTLCLCFQYRCRRSQGIL